MKSKNNLKSKISQLTDEIRKIALISPIENARVRSAGPGEMLIQLNGHNHVSLAPLSLPSMKVLEHYGDQQDFLYKINAR